MQKTIFLFPLFFLFLSFDLYPQESRGFKPVTINIGGTLTTLYSGSHALLIGVADYDFWPDLPGVEDDLSEVEKTLTEHGFQVRIVRNPNKKQLQQAYEDFINDYGMDVNNRLLFYFAGHGHTLKTSYGEDMGYIVPADAQLPAKNLNGFRKHALSMEQMDVYAQNIQSKHALFMFDACFSGSIFALSRAVPEVISYKTTQHVRQFITSGDADEKVPDKSIFREQFVDALITDVADGNNDGFLTGTELGEYLQSAVVNYSFNAQHPQYGKIRHPQLDKGDFVFVLRQPEKENVTHRTPEAEDRGNAGQGTFLSQFGSIELSTEIGGDLFLNSKKIQYLTPQSKTMLKDLTPGTHRLEIDGAEKWEQTVEISAGETLYVEAKSRKDLKIDNKWILVEGGTFQMGSENGDPHEMPVHRVKISDFAIQQHEVTNVEYADFLNHYGSDQVKSGPHSGENLVSENEKGLRETSSGWKVQYGYEQHPVIQVTWFGARAYCEYIGARLPTEAEWEYAARGGKMKKVNEFIYSGGHQSGPVAWTYENANNSTNRVMTKNPNSLDLYDMSGNVWEWCSDWYDANYYATCDEQGKVNDPAGPGKGIYKVMRGGSWSYNQRFATNTYRYKTHPGSMYYDLGFRCVKSVKK